MDQQIPKWLSEHIMILTNPNENKKNIKQQELMMNQCRVAVDP